LNRCSSAWPAGSSPAAAAGEEAAAGREAQEAAAALAAALAARAARNAQDDTFRSPYATELAERAPEVRGGGRVPGGGWDGKGAVTTSLPVALLVILPEASRVILPVTLLAQHGINNNITDGCYGR
jgi:hypothetical protein